VMLFSLASSSLNKISSHSEITTGKKYVRNGP
jgi:hypothetical protein